MIKRKTDGRSTDEWDGGRMIVRMVEQTVKDGGRIGTRMSEIGIRGIPTIGRTAKTSGLTANGIPSGRLMAKNRPN